MSTSLGVLLYAVSIGADVLLMITTYGATSVFGHFTHCSNATLVFLLALFVIVDNVVDFVWVWLSPRVVQRCERALGIVAVCGTSIAFMLYLATTALLLGYDGQLMPDSQYRAGDSRYERTTAIMVAEHWLPLFVWLPLYGGRCEVHILTVRSRVAAWYLSLLIPGLSWIAVLVATGNSVETAYGFELSSELFLAAGITTFLPWAVVVWA